MAGVSWVGLSEICSANEFMEQNIHQRLLKLKDVALGHSKTVSVNSALSNASYDCGIDALLAVYAECSESTSLAKDKNVAKFLHNCECDTILKVVSGRWGVWEKVKKIH